MSEYKVKFHARVNSLFGPSGSDVAVYDANTAKEAVEMCKKEFEEKLGIWSDEVVFTIEDVQKI